VFEVEITATYGFGENAQVASAVLVIEITEASAYLPSITLDIDTFSFVQGTDIAGSGVRRSTNFITANFEGSPVITHSELPSGISSGMLSNFINFFGTPAISGVFEVEIIATHGIQVATAILTIEVLDGSGGVPPVNRNDLNRAITEAESRNSENYTTVTWTAVFNALRTARTVLDNENAAQAQINATAATLWTAIAELVPVQILPEPGADRALLLAAIAEAESRTQDDYTSTTWTAVHNALNTARTVRDNELATQSQIDTTTDTLWATIHALEPAQIIPEPGIDRSALVEAISEAESRTQHDYTSVTWTAMQNSLRTARTVRDNENATQAQIDATANALWATVDALTPAPVIPAPGADRSALTSAIEDAELRVQANYTSASWTRVANALRTARTVHGNANATQAQIDAVTNTLLNAINTLVIA
jgi:hypothetical protein